MKGPILYANRPPLAKFTCKRLIVNKGDRGCTFHGMLCAEAMNKMTWNRYTARGAPDAVVFILTRRRYFPRVLGFLHNSCYPTARRGGRHVSDEHGSPL